MIEKIKIDNLEMEYFKFGNGNKTMVILPGVSLTSVMKSEHIIKAQYNIFNDEFKVYVFDRKLNMEKSYNVYDMADDMIKVFDELKLNNIYLFGASQGGMISCIISYKRPDLIKKLNVNSISYRISDDNYELFNTLINCGNNNKIYELVDTFCKYAYSTEFYKNIKDTLKPFVDSLTKLDIERFIIQSSALKGFNIFDDLKNIKCETLIIASKQDQIFDYFDSLIINKIIINSKIYIYDNYGHAVYDEALDIKQKIYDFYME